MLAQPVVAAVVLAYVMGEPQMGVWAAMTFQLLWAGQLPVGAYVPPNVAIMAMAAVGIATAAAGPTPVRAIVGGAVAIPAGIAAGRLDVWVKTLNIKIVHQAEKDLANDRPYALGLAVARATGHFFMKDVLILFFSVFGGGLILHYVASASLAGLSAGWEFAYAVSPAVGVGVWLRHYWNQRNATAFGIGMVVAAALWVLVFSFK